MTVLWVVVIVAAVAVIVLILVVVLAVVPFQANITRCGEGNLERAAGGDKHPNTMTSQCFQVLLYLEILFWLDPETINIVNDKVNVRKTVELEADATKKAFGCLILGRCRRCEETVEL